MSSVRKADMPKPRSLGAFYTPENIARLIVESAIGRLCEGRSPDEIARLRILDPACGDGAFLTAARDFLIGHGLTHDQALRCVYGVDVDKGALNAARNNLVQRPASSVQRPGTRDSGLPNLIHGDSLLGLDWQREFPDVMKSGGFDAVIGNPPWVSLSGRFGTSPYTQTQIERLKEHFGGNSYMPNAFEYFVSLGLELTKPGGYFSFIVPDRLGFNRQFAEIRKRLLTQAELLELIHDVPFPGVVADTLIFVFRKNVPTPKSRVEISEYGKPSVAHLQSALLVPGYEFPRPIEPAVLEIVEKMESLGGPRLGDVCEITSGFGGRSPLIAETRMSDTQIPVLKGSSIDRYAVKRSYWFDFRRENLTGRTVDPAKLGATPKVLIRKTGNRLIAAYDDSGTFPEQSLYFLYRRDVTGDSNSLAPNAFGESRNGIPTQRDSGRAGVRAESGASHPHPSPLPPAGEGNMVSGLSPLRRGTGPLGRGGQLSTVNCQPSTNLDFLFILGILNSRLMNLYYQARCLTNRRSFAQVKMLDLERIPLPPVDRASHARMVELVDEMLRRPSPAMDKQIDDLACNLYGVKDVKVISS